MEYIRAHEMNEILNHYHEIESLIEVFNLEIKSIMNEEGADAIYGGIVRRNIDGMPFVTGKISDRTASVSMNYNNELSQEQGDAIREIRNEIRLLDITLQKLKISIGALRPKLRNLVELRYFEGCSWQEIANKLYADNRTIMRYKANVLKILSAISRITLHDYRDIKDLLTKEKR